MLFIVNKLNMVQLFTPAEKITSSCTAVFYQWMTIKRASRFTPSRQKNFSILLKITKALPIKTNLRCHISIRVMGIKLGCLLNVKLVVLCMKTMPIMCC